MYDGMRAFMRNVTINRSKLFEQVAMHLQREIMEGRFKPANGCRLGELVPRTGSDVPTREALLSLERADWCRPGTAPARVAMPEASKIVAASVSNPPDAVDAGGPASAQGFRLFIEVGWVRHAAQNASDANRTVARRLEANRRPWESRGLHP